MPKAKVNDVNLYYEIYGQGSPVVFVAGLSADHSAWQSIVDRFAKKHTVLLFDNRGVGQSDCPAQTYTIEMMVDDTANLLNKLQLGPAHFVGNSMGGIIVQGVASQYPHLTKTAVISNSFYCPGKHERLVAVTNAQVELRQAQIFHPALLKMNFAGLYSNKFLSKKGILENLLANALANPYPITNQGYINQLQALLTSDTSKWLEKIKCPCLVIAADEDFWSDLQQAQYLMDNIEQVQYFCFNGVGHLPHIEQPEIFSQVVMDFINK